MRNIKNLESLIVSATNCETFDQQLKKVVEFYNNDLNSSTLSVQLQNLGSWFKEKSERFVLKDCIEAMQDICLQRRKNFSVKFAQLLDLF